MSQLLQRDNMQGVIKWKSQAGGKTRLRFGCEMEHSMLGCNVRSFPIHFTGYWSSLWRSQQEKIAFASSHTVNDTSCHFDPVCEIHELQFGHFRTSFKSDQYIRRWPGLFNTTLLLHGRRHKSRPESNS